MKKNKLFQAIASILILILLVACSVEQSETARAPTAIAVPEPIYYGDLTLDITWVQENNAIHIVAHMFPPAGFTAKPQALTVLNSELLPIFSATLSNIGFDETKYITPQTLAVYLGENGPIFIEGYGVYHYNFTVAYP